MKPEVGTQYFIFWQTGLSGPFTYEGGDNYVFQDFITGDVRELLLAQKGFDYMFERWTFDDKRGEFAQQIKDIVAHDFINAEIAKTDDADVIQALEALKANSHQFPGVE